VALIADELVVIGHGRILAQGTKAELVHGSGTVVRGADPHALASALSRAQLSFTTHVDGGFLVDAEPDSVGKAAAVAGAVLNELRPVDSAVGLEELFLQLTGREGREGVRT
jgi:ABC-2 type transport system ATP-binding protein